jgi:hypothetical protein
MRHGVTLESTANAADFPQLGVGRTLYAFGHGRRTIADVARSADAVRAGRRGTPASRSPPGTIGGTLLLDPENSRTNAGARRMETKSGIGGTSVWWSPEVARHPRFRAPEGP